MAAEVVGSVVERELLEAVFHDKAALDAPLGEHMSRPLPMIGSGEPVGAAMGALEKADAAVVLVDGKQMAAASEANGWSVELGGHVTRQDLLGFLAGRQ